ncbi:MAG: glycoside hydrolase family 2 TIM barrel-domain containing protein [Pirellulaceae bacterium]
MIHLSKPPLSFLLSIAGCLCAGWADLDAQAVPVTLKQDTGGWQLLRDGEPFYINGAGGMGSLTALAAAGGNSSRTWGVDDIDETMARLDEAHRQGISVAFGIWLEHERHGKLDYDDEQAVQQQLNTTLEHVRRFKDHPAILVWGIGNEMEGDGRNPKIWSHIEDIARQVKEIDPYHPVMTVLAEIGDSKVPDLHRICPSIDIVGINSYGGTTSLPDRYQAAGGTKPYIVTEFGPHGPWEVGQDNTGAVREFTSTEKADLYRLSWTALKADSNLCLGSYAFLWGHKQEATATWFGMFLQDERKTAAVDTMTELWSGKAPENLCPRIDELLLRGRNEVAPGAELNFSLLASDPEGQTIKIDWVLMANASSMVTGGDFQETPPAFPELIQQATEDGATIKAPTEPGIYRVYAYVGDGNGAAAVANVPFRVRSPQEESPQGAQAELPFVVYDEPASSTAFAASGWMGNTGAISLDDGCKDNPHAGEHCLKFGYSSGGNWGGVVWQNPPDDWGDKPGGFDLTGATKLTFWARGAEGGEKMKFGFGLLGRDKTHFDTGKKETDEISLTTEWQQYSIDLTDLDLARIKTGFYWTLAGQGKPLEFYLDDIMFEKE